MPALELAKHCRAIGIERLRISVRIIRRTEAGAEDFTGERRARLQKGPCVADNKAFVLEKLKLGIDLAAEIGTKSVIAFTACAKGSPIPPA